ncbi:LytTR family transcriptional regulator [bacterium]|nr:LytTR family transcriptional regulator [bacterium]
MQRAALDAMAGTALEEQDKDQYIAAKTHSGHERIAVSDIRLLLADQRYVMAYLPSREVLLDIPLKEFESRYAHIFLRIHRNALVAKHFVQALERDDGNSVLRIADITLRPIVSRRMLSQVRKLIEGDS